MTPDTPAPSADAAFAPRGRPPPRSARSRSREFALQALYQVLVGRNEAAAVDTFTRD
ncbi:MAG: N utilization substance protein B, partial [Limnohabitans sp.]